MSSRASVRGTSNRRIFLSLAAFVGIAFAFPFYYMQQHNSDPSKAGHMHSKSAMRAQQAIRGAYINSGSKDVGYDDTYYKKHQQQLLRAEGIQPNPNLNINNSEENQ
jgi:hypothetical protein